MNYDRLIRRIRQRIFDYYDASEEMGQKATRILDKALRRLSAQLKAQMTPAERERREMRAVLKANPWLTATDFY